MNQVHRYGRVIPGPIERLRRFAQRKGSLSATLGGISEELTVRALDRQVVRDAVSLLRPPREPKAWVFLVGCYNSGTSLLQSVLSAHPSIAGMPREGVRFTGALSNLETQGHHMYWGDDWRDVAAPSPADTARAVARIKRDWGVFWKRGADRFLDKSISNTARIAWLDANFANAHFIGIHRNGLCVAEGLHRRNRPPEWMRQETGFDHYPLDMVARFWATINNEMLDQLDRVERKLLVRFDDLVHRPVETLERILRFLGIDGGNVAFVDRRLQFAGQTFSIANPDPSSLARLGEVAARQLAPIIDPVADRLERAHG